MVQRGGRSGLLLEAMQARRVRRERSRQNFNGDIPAESGIPSAIHLAHATRTHRRYDLVRTEFCPASKRHCFPPHACQFYPELKLPDSISYRQQRIAAISSHPADLLCLENKESWRKTGWRLGRALPIPGRIPTALS